MFKLMGKKIIKIRKYNFLIWTNDILVKLTCFYSILNPTHIRKTSSFSILGVLGGIYRFCSNFNRTFCKQTVEILIRCRVVLRLLLVCTVWMCATKIWVNSWNKLAPLISTQLRAGANSMSILIGSVISIFSKYDHSCLR